MIGKLIDKVRAVSWRPLRKIVAAGLSGITASGVVAFLAESGVDVSGGVGSLIATGAAVLAGYLWPERKTRTQ